MTKSLINEFNNFINRNNLNLANKTLLIGVSCGVDSTVLLDVLEKSQKKYNFDIVICHVNHKRRAQSELEEAFIKDYSLGKHKLYVKSLDYDEFEDKDNIANFQEYARNERIKFFLEVAKKKNAEYLLLAHHINDDIETSLMHITRSSDLDSICGIKEVTKYKSITILRPLLRVLKEDIYQYAKENDIKFFEDESNAHDDYTRNRFRHNIVGEFFKENPSFDSAFISFKEKLEYASKLMNEKRDNIIKSIVINDENSIRFSYDSFVALDNVMQKEVLFELLKKYDYSLLNIVEIIKIINTNKKSFVNNYKDICIIKANEMISISNEKYNKENIDVLIEDIGEYNLNEKYKLVLSKITKDDKLNLKKINKDFISKISIIWYNTCMLPFRVRSRHEGDVISLPNGHKKVKDLLIDEHLNVIERDKALLLLDKEDEIISVLGIRKSAKLLNTELDNCDIKIELLERVRS